MVNPLLRQLTLKNVAIVLIGGFFTIQVASLIISELFPDVPIFKGGPAILLMLLSIAVLTLFIIGIKIDELRRKENLVFILILFALVGLAYWKLPEIFPQLFTIGPDISDTIKQTVGSVVG